MKSIAIVYSPCMKRQPNFLWIMLSILLLTFNQFAQGAISTNKNKLLHTVKVVYFYPADAKLSSDWKNRLDRTLKDISSYYKTELGNSGFKSDGIPFEADDSG